jgi:LysR family glycine cleavage system transcriptional activator
MNLPDVEGERTDSRLIDLMARAGDPGAGINEGRQPVARDRPANSRRSARMPSLNAIRAFEAVARYRNYGRAARELHVTTSAVSHQIKAIEDHFGVPLLRMIDRQVTLTVAGDWYYRQISQGLTQLAVATRRLLEGKGERILRVTMAPTLATWWLIPRLQAFFSACPELSLEIAATTVPADFALGQYDVAIRYAQRVQSGLHATAIGQNRVFPVCSPRLRDQAPPLRAIEDLRSHTLISTRDELLIEEPLGNWDGWLRAANHPHLSGVRQIRLSPRGLMLQAAAQGVGVGLARTLLATDALRTGQLVCPFGPSFPLSANYYVVCPESSAKDRDIGAFRDWMIAEARASAKAIDIPHAREESR